MIENFKKLINNYVYKVNSDISLARVYDLVFDMSTNKILAFIVSTSSLIPITRIISIDNVDNIEKNRIVVKSENSITGFSTLEFPDTAVMYVKNFLKKKAYSLDNSEKGRISDLIYNSEIGEITDFVISKNIFENFMGKGEKVSANKILLKDNNIIITQQ